MILELEFDTWVSAKGVMVWRHSAERVRQFAINQRAHQMVRERGLRSGAQSAFPPPPEGAKSWTEVAEEELADQTFEDGPPRYGPVAQDHVPRRLVHEGLDAAVVIEFLAARDVEAMCSFFGRFGHFARPLPPDQPPGLWHLDVESVWTFQQFLRSLVVLATSNQKEATPIINALLTMPSGREATPPWERVGIEIPDRLKSASTAWRSMLNPLIQPHMTMRDGKPRLALRPMTLSSFLALEVALIAMSGASFVTCEQCGKPFLAGTGTSRRTHAKYCSDRCRVAAMRQRNREAF